jgi:hypothetical protein
VRAVGNEKPPLPVEKFQGITTTRLYYAKIEQAWFNDNRHLKRKVDLAKLRGLSNIA